MTYANSSANTSDDVLNVLGRIHGSRACAISSARNPGSESLEDRRTLYAVSAGHFIVDMCQGTVPVMLPLLMSRLNLSYAQAGMVITATYLTSSVTQPLFGLIKIKAVQKIAMPLGVGCACLLLALAGQSASYPLLLLLAILSSAGVAMYHPEAAATASRASGTANRSKGMSVFAMCGSVGFTFGPLIFGPVLAATGLHGALFLLLPAVVLPLVILRFASHPAPVASLSARGTHERQGQTQGSDAASMAGWRSPVALMALLVAVVALSRWAMAGTMTFLPLYFTRYLGLAPGIGNRAMIAFQIGGDAGTLACGFLVARYGARRTLLAGLIAAAPFLLAFPHASGFAPLPLLFLANFMLALTVLSTTLLGQEFLPHNKALAASLTLGFGTGIGGLGSGLLGRVADLHGIPAALVFVGIAPALGALLSLLLFERRQKS